MSHFTTLVVVKTNADLTEMQAEAEELLAPFSENISVPEYETRCHCDHYTETKQPDPGCEDCHGSGVRHTTYNPYSQWDWYELGGRWEGALKGDNYQTVIDWQNDPERYYPFAVLTPHGWSEKGKMGWWGMVADEKEELGWHKQVDDILAAFADGHTLLVYDLHI